jgi:hypothetical protein
MIPKKLAPAKAGVADFSDKIMRKIKENRARVGSTLSKNASIDRAEKNLPWGRHLAYSAAERAAP